MRHSPRHAAMILDANTGAVLHEEDGDQPRHPASLTKMMTLYLTFETLEQGRMAMSSMVKISQEAASVAPSKLDLDPGEEISVSDAVRALITKSANDVAVALAEKIGGSQANFVRLMNAKARDLGMNKTNFENASGLPDPDQVTTARDMITLALHLQDDFPQHYPLFALRAFSYKGHSHRNHNTLMNNFAGIDGIKTGYTRASGFNLVTSVRRGGRHLVGAVFGGPSAATRNGEMRMLLTRALNRASTTKTRKSAPMLVAKLKGEPKRAERPAQKELAKKELAQVELVAKEADQKPRWVTVAAPAAQPNVEPMPKPSVKAKVRPPAAAPMQAAAKTGTAGEPAAAASVTADTAPPSASGAVPVEVTPVEVTPVEVTKVRRVMVAPRQGPKRPPPGPAETTDMASSDDGSDDNANGSDLGLPEISETIVPKNDAPARPMFAAAGESKASMLGAADVTPPVTVAETGEAASAVIEVAPAVAVPAAKPALKTVPAAAAAIAPAVQSSKPAQRAKVLTASLTAPAAPATAAKPKPAASAAAPRAPERAFPSVQRGMAPSSLAAQAAALKAPPVKAQAPQRVASLTPQTSSGASAPAPGRFEIQIGAYGSVGEAQKALSTVQAKAGDALGAHPSVTQPVTKAGRQVFRARFRGFDANSAASACTKLRQQAFDCFVMTAE